MTFWTTLSGHLRSGTRDVVAFVARSKHAESCDTTTRNCDAPPELDRPPRDGFKNCTSGRRERRDCGCLRGNHRWRPFDAILIQDYWTRSATRFRMRGGARSSAATRRVRRRRRRGGAVTRLTFLSSPPPRSLRRHTRLTKASLVLHSPLSLSHGIDAASLHETCTGQRTCDSAQEL